MPSKFKSFVRHVMIPRQTNEATRQAEAAEEGSGISADFGNASAAIEAQGAPAHLLSIASRFGTWPMLRSSVKQEVALILPQAGASIQGEDTQPGWKADSDDAAALEAASTTPAPTIPLIAPSSPTLSSCDPPLRASRLRRSPLPSWSVRASSRSSTLYGDTEVGDSHPEIPSYTVQEHIQTRAAEVRDRVASLMDDSGWLGRPVSGATMQELPWLKETTKLLDTVSTGGAEIEALASPSGAVQEHTRSRSVLSTGRDFSRECQLAKGNLAMLKGFETGQDGDGLDTTPTCQAETSDINVEAGPSEFASSAVRAQTPTTTGQHEWTVSHLVSSTAPRQIPTKAGSRFKEQIQGTGRSLSPGRRATLRVSPWSSATRVNDSGENLDAAISRSARLPPQGIHPALRQTAASAQSESASQHPGNATALSPTCDKDQRKSSSRYTRVINASWTPCQIVTISAFFLGAILCALVALAFYPRGVAITLPFPLGGGPRNFTLFAEDGSRLVLRPLPDNLTLMQLYPMRTLFDGYNVEGTDEPEFKRVVGGMENLHWAHTRWSAVMKPRLWQLWVLYLAVIGVYQALCVTLRGLVIFAARRRWDSRCRGQARSLFERSCERMMWQGREVAVIFIAATGTALVVASVVWAMLNR